MESVPTSELPHLELKHRTIFLASQIILKLELIHPMSTVVGARVAFAHGTRGTLGFPEFQSSHQSYGRKANLHESQPTTNATSWAYRKRVPSALGPLNLFAAVLGTHNPAFGDETVWVWVVSFVVMDSVHGRSDVEACGHINAIDQFATFVDLAPHRSTCWG